MLATADYTLEHASLDFLTARREENERQLRGKPSLQRKEDAKIAAEVQTVQRRAQAKPARPTKPAPKGNSSLEIRIAEPVKYIIGHEFRKWFGGNCKQWFTGRVVGYKFPDVDEPVDAPIYYKVRYEDGELEDLEKREIDECATVRTSTPQKKENKEKREATRAAPTLRRRSTRVANINNQKL
jgi:hypothetical protein